MKATIPCRAHDAHIAFSFYGLRGQLIETQLDALDGVVSMRTDLSQIDELLSRTGRRMP